MITVLLADDRGHERLSFVRFISEAPRLELVGEVDTAEQALTFLRRAAREGTRVDVVMMDVDFYFDAGASAKVVIPAIRTEFPGVRILAMTNHPELRDLAHQARAHLVVTKDRLQDWALIEARIDDVLAVKVDAPSRATPVLTRIEIVVLNGKARGHTNKVIAAELGRSERTIDTHVSNIRRKLGADNLAEAVAIASDLGLIGATARRQGAVVDRAEGESESA